MGQHAIQKMSYIYKSFVIYICTHINSYIYIFILYINSYKYIHTFTYIHISPEEI